GQGQVHLLVVLRQAQADGAARVCVFHGVVDEVVQQLAQACVVTLHKKGVVQSFQLQSQAMFAQACVEGSGSFVQQWGEIQRLHVVTQAAAVGQGEVVEIVE